MEKKKSKPLGYWKGREGLERAREEILKLKKELGRTTKLREVDVVYNAITSGHWGEYGITSGLELL